MVKYLVLKILFLVLFALAYVLVPLALPFIFVIAVIAEGVNCIRNGNDPDFSLKTQGVFIILGIVLIIASFSFMTKITNWLTTADYALPLVFSIVTILGGIYSMRFIKRERYNYYMDDKINLLTKFHPYLIIVSGALKLLAISKLIKIHTYISVIEIVGIVLFVIAIAMYILRTVHIYMQNK